MKSRFFGRPPLWLPDHYPEQVYQIRWQPQQGNFSVYLLRVKGGEISVIGADQFESVFSAGDQSLKIRLDSQAWANPLGQGSLLNIPDTGVVVKRPSSFFPKSLRFSLDPEIPGTVSIVRLIPADPETLIRPATAEARVFQVDKSHNVFDSASKLSSPVIPASEGELLLLFSVVKDPSLRLDPNVVEEFDLSQNKQWMSGVLKPWMLKNRDVHLIRVEADGLSILDKSFFTVQYSEHFLQHPEYLFLHPSSWADSVRVKEVRVNGVHLKRVESGVQKIRTVVPGTLDILYEFRPVRNLSRTDEALQEIRRFSESDPALTAISFYENSAASSPYMEIPFPKPADRNDFDWENVRMEIYRASFFSEESWNAKFTVDTEDRRVIVIPKAGMEEQFLQKLQKEWPAVATETTHDPSVMVIDAGVFPEHAGLEEFFSNSEVQSVLPYLAQQDRPTRLEGYFDGLDERLAKRGYKQMVSIPLSGSGASVSLESLPITLLVQTEWKSVMKERFSGVPGLTLTDDPEAATFVVGDPEFLAQIQWQGRASQAFFLQADGASMDQITPAFLVNVMAYLQAERLPSGTTVVVGGMVYDDLRQAVTALYIFV